MASRMRAHAAADAESRKKLFRATAGMSLQQQLQVATQLQSKGDDVLQRIHQMKKTSRHQKQATKENNLKYEWLHEHQHLNKLEDACTKELESLLLRIYNDACAEKAAGSSASSVLKSKKSPSRPEVEPQESPSKKPVGESPIITSQQYAKEIGELVQMEQDYRIALLKHAASEREQRLAMKQLVVGLRQRMQKSSSGSAVAVTERMKCEAQELIFDSVIGHQMVEGALEEEFKTCERDFQATYEAVMQGLRSDSAGRAGKRRLPSSNQIDDGSVVDELVNSLCGDAQVDELLRLEIRDQFAQLQDDLLEDLAAFERDFKLLASQEDAAGSVEAASSNRGGWSSEEDEKYLAVLKNYERRPGAQKKPELLYDQVKAVLPHRDRAEIKKHAKFHTHLRFYQDKCRDRQTDYDRKFADLRARAKEKIAAAKQQEDDKRLKLEQLEQLQMHCAQLHDKVTDWKVTKDAEKRIKDQQDALERLLIQQQKEAEEAKWKRRHNEQKAQVEEFKNSKLVGTLVDEIQAEQQREREEQEKAQQSVINAERVQFRQDEHERKLAEDRLERQRKEQLDAERIAKLEAIKLETPYAEKLATIVADPERTRQETAAFRTNVEAVDDGLPLHEKGLFPTHGYDCETLFKNARFKLGIALRSAGLHQTEYARKALATIKVSNAGAYRHAVAPTTQLW